MSIVKTFLDLSVFTFWGHLRACAMINDSNRWRKYRNASINIILTIQWENQQFVNRWIYVYAHTSRFMVRFTNKLWYHRYSHFLHKPWRKPLKTHSTEDTTKDLDQIMQMTLLSVSKVPISKKQLLARPSMPALIWMTVSSKKCFSSFKFLYLFEGWWVPTISTAQFNCEKRENIAFSRYSNETDTKEIIRTLKGMKKKNPKDTGNDWKTAQT